MTEENFYLYRTNMKKIENTQDNLLRCSNVCEKIDSDRLSVKENILPIALRESGTRTGVDTSEENCVLIFYVKLVGQHTTLGTAINIFSGYRPDSFTVTYPLYTVNGYTVQDQNDVIIALGQKALVVNGEITPYTAVIIPTIRNFNEFVKTAGNVSIKNPFTGLESIFNRISGWSNPQNDLGEIKFDFLPRRTFNI